MTLTAGRRRYARPPRTRPAGAWRGELTLPVPAPAGARAGHPPGRTLAPAMVDSSVTSQPSTLPEVARVLGVSESTVRRLVRAGKLEAERVLRPQRHVWMVRVPTPSTDPPEDPPRWVGASPANPPDQPAAPPTLTAWMTSVLEPLVAELNGRQSAELERAAATIVTLGDELAAERAKSIMPTTASQSSTAALDASTLPQSDGTAPGHVRRAPAALDSGADDDAGRGRSGRAHVRRAQCRAGVAALADQLAEPREVITEAAPPLLAPGGITAP
jgi:excisionase family DNA binding protein